MKSPPPSEPNSPVGASEDLSVPELAALQVFRDFHVAPGEMFCFTGPMLEKHQKSLIQLVGRNLLVKEQFTSGYSMTAVGYRAMITARRCK
jgi:hypothetical protein